MPAAEFDGVFFVKTVPEISFEDGLFHICYQVGRARFEFVLPPHIALKARHRAGQAVEKFGTDNVRDFKRGHS